MTKVYCDFWSVSDSYLTTFGNASSIVSLITLRDVSDTFFLEKYKCQHPSRDFSPNLKQDLSGLSGFF